ncbi:MAG TPA: hypothetical protein VD997_01020 [Phycisphaerales bacterium]|nr:hypothetical protein [Phycisphaerales bacterium]
MESEEPRPGNQNAAPATTSSTPAPALARRGIHRLHALYPNHYCWFLLLSSMDVMLTDAILNVLKGRELNTVGDFFISRFGLWGAIGLKFTTVVITIAIIEFVGRRRPDLGRKLAVVPIIITCIPVAWGLFLLAVGLSAGHDDPSHVPEAP